MHICIYSQTIPPLPENPHSEGHTTQRQLMADCPENSLQRLHRSTRMGWWDLFKPLSKPNARALVAALLPRPLKTSTTRDSGLRKPEIYDQSLPESSLPPVYHSGPLNLNPDGSTITYKKSHVVPNATNWEQADAEEMERLFTSGTLRPIMPEEIIPRR
jgi:hypothetical protein